MKTYCNWIFRRLLFLKQKWLNLQKKEKLTFEILGRVMEDKHVLFRYCSHEANVLKEFTELVFYDHIIFLYDRLRSFPWLFSFILFVSPSFFILFFISDFLNSILSVVKGKGSSSGIGISRKIQWKKSMDFPKLKFGSSFKRSRILSNLHNGEMIFIRIKVWNLNRNKQPRKAPLTH